MKRAEADKRARELGIKNPDYYRLPELRKAIKAAEERKAREGSHEEN